MKMKIMLLLAAMFSCAACTDNTSGTKKSVTCVTNDGLHVTMDNVLFYSLPVDDVSDVESSSRFYKVAVNNEVYLVPKDQCYIHYKP